MKININKDTIIGFILVIFGFMAGISNSKLDVEMTLEYPGPKLFPYIGAFGLIICGLGIIIQGLRSQNVDQLHSDLKGWKRIFFAFFVLLLYYLGLKYLGFLISTPITLLILTIIFDDEIKNKIPQKLIFTLIFTILVYLIYRRIFNMQLPKGILF